MRQELCNSLVVAHLGEVLNIEALLVAGGGIPGHEAALQRFLTRRDPSPWWRRGPTCSCIMLPPLSPATSQCNDICVSGVRCQRLRGTRLLWAPRCSQHQNAPRQRPAQHFARSCSKNFRLYAERHVETTPRRFREVLCIVVSHGPHVQHHRVSKHNRLVCSVHIHDSERGGVAPHCPTGVQCTTPSGGARCHGVLCGRRGRWGTPVCTERQRVWRRTCQREQAAHGCTASRRASRASSSTRDASALAAVPRRACARYGRLSDSGWRNRAVARVESFHLGAPPPPHHTAASSTPTWQAMRALPQPIMPMPVPASVVANAFVSQYFSVRHHTPAHISRFYGAAPSPPRRTCVALVGLALTSAVAHQAQTRSRPGPAGSPPGRRRAHLTARRHRRCWSSTRAWRLSTSRHVNQRLARGVEAAVASLGAPPGF